MERGRRVSDSQDDLPAAYLRDFQIEDGPVVASLEDTLYVVHVLESIFRRRETNARMVYLSVLRSQEDLEGLKVAGRHVLEVDGAEGLGLACVVYARRYLVDSVRMPVVIVDFVLCQEETVEASRVHVHLLDRLTLQDIVVDLADACPSPAVAEALKWSLPYKVAALGKDPDVPILHLCELKLVLGDLHIVGRDELKDVLDVPLVGLEAMHIVEGMRFIVDVNRGCFGLCYTWLSKQRLWLLLYSLLSSQ